MRNVPITPARQEILRDMSAAQAACNSALQELDHACHKSPFGAGRRRMRSAARRVELDQEETHMIAKMNGYLDSVG